MKKTLLLLLVLLAFFGCTQMQQEKTEKQIQFTISGYDNEGKLLFEKQLNSNARVTAFQALLENNVSMEYDEYSFGVLITSIEELTPQKNEYIALYVNNEYSNAGISDIILEEGTKINFRIEKLEN